MEAELRTDVIDWDDGFTKKMWSITWHPQYGFCDTFHLKNKSTPMENGWNDLLYFSVYKYDKIVFFHDEDDLPTKGTSMSLPNNFNNQI